MALAGVGHYVAERVVPNDELAALLGTTPDWIADRSGIRERRVAAPGQTNADMALRASGLALADAGSPDHVFPGVSVELQTGLRVSQPVPAFDLHAQCGGFL